MITIPAPFVAEITGKGGAEGQAWIAALPRLIEQVCDEWHLVIAGAPKHGCWGLVFAVQGAESPAVLKFIYPDANYPLRHTVTTLSLWDGSGAGRLLRYDLARHVLLLERLNAEKTLETLPITQALPIAGALLRRLAIPAPKGFATLQTIAEQTARTLATRWEKLGRPLPHTIIDRTCDLIHTFAPRTANLIVNWDLHYGNVLAGERQPWLVIDPSIVAGDPEYALAQLLWWPLEEVEAAGGVWWGLQQLVAAGDFDPALAPAWTYVRTVDYWLMGLEIGLTIDPPRCQRVIEALEGRSWPD